MRSITSRLQILNVNWLHACYWIIKVIKNITISNKHLYHVKIYNLQMDINHKIAFIITIHILLFRSPPEQPKWWENESPESLIHGKYADRYELRWRVPANNGEPIDMYEISYCPVSFYCVVPSHNIPISTHNTHAFNRFAWMIYLLRRIR